MAKKTAKTTTKEQEVNTEEAPSAKKVEISESGRYWKGVPVESTECEGPAIFPEFDVVETDGVIEQETCIRTQNEHGEFFLQKYKGTVNLSPVLKTKLEKVGGLVVCEYSTEKDKLVQPDKV